MPLKSYEKTSKPVFFTSFEVLVGEGGFEPPKSSTTDLQAVKSLVFSRPQLVFDIMFDIRLSNFSISLCCFLADKCV